MTFTPAVFDLKVNPRVAAVQWTEEAQALELVRWVEEHWNEESGGAYFDEDLVGAGGPNGEDWGHLTIESDIAKYEVAPFDWVVIDALGRIFVLSPGTFTSMYGAV